MLALAILAALAGQMEHTSMRDDASMLTRAPRSGVLADYQFTTCGATATGTRGEVVTCARNSSATYIDAAGVLQTAGVNQCRIDCSGGVAGLLSEPTGSNLALNTGDIVTASGTPGTLNTGWSFNGTSMTKDADGTVDEFTGPANTGLFPSSVGTTATTPYTLSAWVAKPGADAEGVLRLRFVGGNAANCTCWREDGGTCLAVTAGNDCLARLIGLGSSLVRASVSGNAATPPTSLSPGIYNGTSTAPGTIRVGWPQIEAGPVATTYVPSGATPGQRLADAHSIANPLAVTNPASWYVSVTAQPATNNWTSAGTAQALAATTGAANKWQFVWEHNNNFSLFAFDAANAQRLRYGAMPPGTGLRRLTGCNAGGDLSRYVAGALVAGIQSGAGSGVLVQQQSAVALGQFVPGASSANMFHGKFTRLTLGRGCRP